MDLSKSTTNSAFSTNLESFFERQMLQNWSSSKGVCPIFSSSARRLRKEKSMLRALTRLGPELRLAVELKYPRAGQFPEQMFSFCKDIAFLEELKVAGFSSCLFLAVVEQRPFYAGNSYGIYRYFRGGEPLHGKIGKPTGAKDEEVMIEGRYVIRWKELRDGRKYTWVEIDPDTITTRSSRPPPRYAVCRRLSLGRSAIRRNCRVTIVAKENVLFQSWRVDRPGFVKDGVVSEQDYLASSPLIVFILKEANDPELRWMGPTRVPTGWRSPLKRGTMLRGGYTEFATVGKSTTGRINMRKSPRGSELRFCGASAR